jgi:hypothetical protein
VSKLLNSDGLYGKSLVTRIDAPSGPKVSRFLDYVLSPAEVRQTKLINLPSELSTLRENERDVKCFLQYGSILSREMAVGEAIICPGVLYRETPIC